ncbi:MAG: hypothetical protein J0L97_01945 [Alphaproteobacteria bacterium]|nr:hypothetical protein [Alphaproteobacteria bacterium]
MMQSLYSEIYGYAWVIEYVADERTLLMRTTQGNADQLQTALMKAKHADQLAYEMQAHNAGHADFIRVERIDGENSAWLMVKAGCDIGMLVNNAFDLCRNELQSTLDMPPPHSDPQGCATLLTNWRQTVRGEGSKDRNVFPTF